VWKRAKCVDDRALLREHHRLAVRARRRDAELNAAVASDHRGENTLRIAAQRRTVPLWRSPLPRRNAVCVNEIHPLDLKRHGQDYAVAKAVRPSGKQGIPSRLPSHRRALPERCGAIAMTHEILEQQAPLYLLRLAAFVVIIVAVVDRKRR
jgi:hypothetical protein